MVTLLQQMLAFPPHPSPQRPIPDTEYDDGALKIVKLLRDTSSSKLTGTVSEKDTILDIVNPSTNSLPYLFALVAKLEGKSTALKVGTQLWQHVLSFVSSFDSVQVRYAGAEFRKLLDAIEGAGSQDPVLVIEAYKTAILRLDPTNATLTSSHIRLLHLCLAAKAYSLAEPVLERNVYHFPTPTTKNSERDQPNIPLPCSDRHTSSSTWITTQSGLSKKMDYHDHLLYFLYGAMVYIGMWKWERAISLLEIAISAPSHHGTTSMIQVEAYKKWVLLNLLVHGSSRSLPKAVHSATSKHFKALAKAYDVLAEAFKDPEPTKLRAEIPAGPFEADSNYSLALLVLSAHQRFKVRALSETYLSLPLSRVKDLVFPQETSLNEVETYVQNLISNAQLPGAVLSKQQSSTNDSESGPILRFAAVGSEGRTEEELYKNLVEQRNKVGELNGHIKDTQRKMEMSKEYLEALRKARKSESKGQKESQTSQSMPGAFDDEMVADM